MLLVLAYPLQTPKRAKRPRDLFLLDCCLLDAVHLLQKAPNYRFRPSAPPERPSREIRREIGDPIHTPCYAPKRCVCRAFRYAGGGTRTPDTRIMIPLL